jgi:hypothetical protein
MNLNLHFGRVGILESFISTNDSMYYYMLKYCDVHAVGQQSQ